MEKEGLMGRFRLSDPQNHHQPHLGTKEIRVMDKPIWLLPTTAKHYIVRMNCTQ